MVCDKLYTSGCLHQLVSLVTPGRCMYIPHPASLYVTLGAVQSSSRLTLRHSGCCTILILLHFTSPDTQPVVRTVHSSDAEHPQDQILSGRCRASLSGIEIHHRFYTDLTTQLPKPDSALPIQTAPRDWADCVRELPAGSSSSWSLGWTTAINVVWPTETSSWKIRCCRCVLFCLPILGKVCVYSASRLEGRLTGIIMRSLVSRPIKSWTWLV